MVNRTGRLADLFSGPIAAAEADLFAEPLSELLPEEAAQIIQARGERLLEFRGGRHCARVAMAELGLPGGPILRAQDRSPIWPPGVVGSITHTRSQERGYCAAAVARADRVRSIGLDVELDVALKDKLWKRVLTANEQASILAAPEDERGRLATVVFSAKESTYKCQYPVTREFLEFHDVEVTLRASGREFVARLQRRAGDFAEGHAFEGRVLVAAGLVVTGVSLE